MLTREQLEADPWSTYPVPKEELYQLLTYRDANTLFGHPDPHSIAVHSIEDNPDGSVNIEFTVGRTVGMSLIREGLLAVIKRTVEEESMIKTSPFTLTENESSLADLAITLEDDIARLKKEKQSMAMDYLAEQGQWIEETGKFRAEIERLRAALRVYACNCPDARCHGEGTCGDFARAALKENDDD